MMNVAVKNRISTTRKKATLFALVLMIIPLAIYAYVRGPFFCTTGCSISTPRADPSTQSFIEAIVFRDNLPFMAVVPPDASYIVCNATRCAEYQRQGRDVYTAPSSWPSDKPRPGGVGGEGGGDTGGGGSEVGGDVGGAGGTNFGGGCVGRCTGIGEVGPIQQI